MKFDKSYSDYTDEMIEKSEENNIKSSYMYLGEHNKLVEVKIVYNCIKEGKAKFSLVFLPKCLYNPYSPVINYFCLLKKK